MVSDLDMHCFPMSHKRTLGLNGLRTSLCTTHDRRWAKTNRNKSPCVFGSGELKRQYYTICKTIVVINIID